MSRLFAALAPYLKAADAQNHTNGIPVMRPLFFYYQDEADYTEMYEYLLGRDLLVAPVVDKGQTEKEVYFPDDTWVHLWSAEEYTKGHHMIQAPLGEPPVFCRKSSAYLAEFLKLAKV
jgi:alpha-glucosidase